MNKERELLERSIELIDQYWDDSKVGYPRDADNRKLFYEIEELLAQPEQTEPVAWMGDEMFCEDWTTVSSVIKPSKSKYVDNVRPLYLTPPKREPLGLEIMDACGSEDYREGFKDGALYAEKCHGIGEE